MTTFKDRLKEERERLGLSQEELAKRIHPSKRQSFVSNLETGSNKGSSSIAEIAHALGVDAYWLKTGKGNKFGAGRLDGTQQLLLDAFPLLSKDVQDIWLSSARAALKKADDEKRKAA